MDLISVAFPLAWQWGAFALLLPLLAWALATAPWRRFDSSEPVHVWYGTIFAMCVLWSIKASVGATFTFHLLGASVVTLLCGARLALLAVAVVVTVTTWLRDGLWANYALSVLAMGAVPVSITMVVHRVTERYLVPNIFIYFFVVAFLGSGLAMAGSVLIASAAVALAPVQPSTPFDEYSPYVLYLAFGEATVSGMLMTLVVVYRPSWVATFDDKRYLQR
jgi:uncharacterized membrane protein